MQKEQETDFSRSSCTVSSFTFGSTGEALQRIRHVDPRYSMYRWECGGYPYFKVHSSIPPSKCSRIPPGYQMLGTSVEFSDQTPAPLALDVCCSGRGSCCGSGGHEYLPQTEHYVYDQHSQRYSLHHRHSQPELTPECGTVSSGSPMTECHSCGLQLQSHHHNQQQFVGHTVRNHAHLVDVGRTCATSPFRVGTDAVRVYPASRESIELADPSVLAPAPCLPEIFRSHSSGESQSVSSIGKTPCFASLSSPESQSLPELGKSPADSYEPNRSNNVQEEKEASSENDKVQKAGEEGSMTCPRMQKLDQNQTQSHAVKPSEMKVSKRSLGSKITPLYGLPSWWGDEPQSELHSSFSGTSLDTTAPSSTASTHIRSGCTVQPYAVNTRSSPPNLVACRQEDGTSDSKHLRPSAGIATISSQKQMLEAGRVIDSEQNLRCLGSFEKKSPDQQAISSFNETLQIPCNLDGSMTSALMDISGPSINFLGNFRNPGRHSPPERDSPLVLYSTQTPMEQKLTQGQEGAMFEDRGPSKCKSPTAFIVDLEGTGGALSHPEITVKTSLSQFLPNRCQVSLQSRQNSMKQNHKKKMTKEYREMTPENFMTTPSLSEIQRSCSSAEARERFKSSQGCRDSFEDAIADDVSETGTYTIDVSSDNEMKAVADARDSILAAFGISSIHASELIEGNTRASLTAWGSGNELEALLWTNSLSDDAENCNTESLTPTADASGWSFDQENRNLELAPSVNKTTIHNITQLSTDSSKPTPLLSKSDLSPQSDLVLTVYTESASGSIMSGAISKLDSIKSNNISQDANILLNSTSSIRSLDTAILLAEVDSCPKSLLEYDTWKSQLQDPERRIFYTKNQIKKRQADSVDSSLLEHSEGKMAFPGHCSVAESLASESDITESTRDITDQEFFKIPTYSDSRPSFELENGVHLVKKSDYSILDFHQEIPRRSAIASESGESLESSSSVILRDLSPRTEASLDTTVLLKDPEDNFEKMILSFGDQDTYRSTANSSEVEHDFDEDGSSVDPLDDQVSARTIASITTEVLLKPTEEVIQMLGKTTMKKTHRQMKETNRHTTLSEHIGPDEADGRSLRTQAVIQEVNSISQKIGHILEDETITSTEKPKLKKPPKTKPPTPKSCLKSFDPPKSLLSSRRCFSDLDVAEHCETASVRTNTSLVEERGASGKSAESSVEQTRMNRTFALRCARLDSNESKSSETPRLDQMPTTQQRLTRVSKKGGINKSDEVQRSRSASRSRPGKTSARSSLDSPRSVETGVSLGQRIVKKSQENEKKSRQTTENNSYVRPGLRDDDSSSFSSHKSIPPFRPQNATRSVKKKSFEKLQEDINDAAEGLSIKGSHLQSRPASSSTVAQETTENEWTRRKKYNPRQSIQVESSVKKNGKAEGKCISKGNVASEVVLDSKSKTRRKTVDSNARIGGPSSSSDWTDDEKLQLSPHGSRNRNMPTACQLSAKVKLLSDQVLQALRKRPEFKLNEMLLKSPTKLASHIDSMENSPPELLYIVHNLQAAERQMSAIFKMLSTQT